MIIDQEGVKVHKPAKNELGQYPAILTSHLFNNPYILTSLVKNEFIVVKRIPNQVNFSRGTHHVTMSMQDSALLYE